MEIKKKRKANSTSGEVAGHVTHFRRHLIISLVFVLCLPGLVLVTARVATGEAPAQDILSEAALPQEVPPILPKLSEWLSITGTYTLTLSTVNVWGNTREFSQEARLNPGRYFTPSLYLRMEQVEGMAPAGITFEATYDDSLDDLHRLTLKATSGWLQASVGDGKLRFANSEFAANNRRFTGLDLRLTVGPYDFLGVAGVAEGYPYSETFPGTDTEGPYFLSYAPVLEDSEVVRVDGVLLERNRDYTIDYNEGELLFEKPVDATSRIEVDYEYLGERRRLLTGARVGFHKGENVLFGLVYASERDMEAREPGDEPYIEPVPGITIIALEGTGRITDGLVVSGEVARCLREGEEDRAPSGSDALRLDLNFERKPWLASLEYYQIGEGFATIGQLRGIGSEELEGNCQYANARVETGFPDLFHLQLGLKAKRRNAFEVPERPDLPRTITISGDFKGLLDLPGFPELTLTYGLEAVRDEREGLTASTTVSRGVRLRETFGSLKIGASYENKDHISLASPDENGTAEIGELEFGVTGTGNLLFEGKWRVELTDKEAIPGTMLQSSKIMGLSYTPHEKLSVASRYRELMAIDTESGKETMRRHLTISLNGKISDRLSASIEGLWRENEDVRAGLYKSLASATLTMSGTLPSGTFASWSPSSSTLPQSIWYSFGVTYTDEPPVTPADPGGAVTTELRSSVRFPFRPKAYLATNGEFKVIRERSDPADEVERSWKASETLYVNLRTGLHLTMSYSLSSATKREWGGSLRNWNLSSTLLWYTSRPFTLAGTLSIGEEFPPDLWEAIQNLRLDARMTYFIFDRGRITFEGSATRVASPTGIYDKASLSGQADWPLSEGIDFSLKYRWLISSGNRDETKDYEGNTLTARVVFPF